MLRLVAGRRRTDDRRLGMAHKRPERIAAEQRRLAGASRLRNHNFAAVAQHGLHDSSLKGLEPQPDAVGEGPKRSSSAAGAPIENPLKPGVRIVIHAVPKRPLQRNLGLTFPAVAFRANSTSASP
jgi:hypothetical protein